MVEIEKCKNDLKKLRDEVTSRGGARYSSISSAPAIKMVPYSNISFKTG